ncbi:MAG: response regulator transcription factor NblR [Prochlorothrix sp.]|nr:response regulator transcription factor [Prochlorothrix sp.]
MSVAPSPSPPMAVLLVEPDAALAQQMAQDLQEAGYGTIVTTSFTDGLQQGLQHQPTLVVIDRLLAGESGLKLCQDLRHQGYRNSLLLLMAHDSLDDRVACLECGADDYVLKPYRSDSFLQLVRLYLQPSATASEQLRFSDLTLDLSTRRALRQGRSIDLTMKEFELLKYLMEHPREVLTREQILENVWGYEFMGESNVIEVYIRYLRLKIENDGEKRLIQTVRGVGYVLRES